MTTNDHKRYANAVMFAIEMHQGQTRNTGQPYIIHPLRVTESLRTLGGIEDQDVLIAGLFHDLIEDTECDYGKIQDRFGPRVADLVSILSGDMRLPRKQRRRDILDRIKDADDDAKAIRLADRLDNLGDMEGFSESYKPGYTAGGRKILELCHGANQGLEQALETLIIDLEAKYGKHSTGTG